MCGRFVLDATREAVQRLFRVQIDGPFAPRFNIAPTQPVLFVHASGSSRAGRAVDYARWGLIPAWHKDPANAQIMINARSETVLDKPSFRGPIRHRRVLVPATHFYEWQREGQTTQPYAVNRKNPDAPDGLFALAGIVDELAGPDGGILLTLALLTQEADGALATIHHRMPVVVPPAHFGSWLDTDTVEARFALEPLRTPAPDAWTLWPVDRAVNRAGVDGAQLLQEVKPMVPEPPKRDPQMDLF